MATTKLSEKYQIVIPKIIREKMALKAGVSVTLQPLDDERAILLKHPYNHVKALQALGHKVWSSVNADAYLRNLKKEWRR